MKRLEFSSGIRAFFRGSGRRPVNLGSQPWLLAIIILTQLFEFARCPLMGWSGRAPAPPASEAGKGRQRRGARHVSDSQYRNRRVGIQLRKGGTMLKAIGYIL